LALSAYDLRTESLRDPQGIDVLHPKFSWKLAADGRGAKQTAYRIIVASHRDAIEREEGDMWDSGKVDSGETVHIRYQGKPLQSGKPYFWRVMVWDRHGEASPWSDAAAWSMGLLRRNEWIGRWIGLKSDAEPTLTRPKPCVYVRKTFRVDKAVRRAIIYATALGVYKLYLNGRPVGDDVFAPEWTDYKVRLQYQTYEVTHLLAEGENALASVLGHGWYSGRIGRAGYQIYGYDPQLMMQLHVEYEDGTTQIVATDGSWKASFGPLVYSDFLLGECYDARLELPDWQYAHGDDSQWQPVRVFHGYKGWLVAQKSPTVQVVRRLAPVSVRKTGDGVWLVDMGQNMTGWLRVKLRGTRGQEVTLRYAEALDRDGGPYVDNLRDAKQTDRYIFGKDTEIEYEPQFTFHGFRYVEISGLTELNVADVTGHVVHSRLPETGSFECSHPLINRLWHNIFWTQRSNFVSVPTDCPQRDERLGWMGDAQLFFRTASYNMDVYAFFRKWLQDIRDGQLPTGCYPDIAPHVRHSKVYPIIGSAGWADAGVILPWEMYRVYGDRDVIEENYDSMAAWIRYNLTLYPDLIVNQLPQFGDWLSLPTEDDSERFEQVGTHVSALSTTPYDVFSTAYFAHVVKLMAKMAEVIGRTEDEERYARLFEEIKQAFNDAFVQPDGRIKGNTQAAYAMALHMDLLPEHLREAALDRLIRLLEKRDWHVSAGIHGIKYMLHCLTRYGRADIVYRLLLKETFPSWLYMIKNGATTIWERWDGFTEERGFQNAEMNSFSHYALGTVGEWLYRHAAGIRPSPGEPGYRNVVIHPVVGGGLSWVKSSYESDRGTIRVFWETDGTSFRMTVTVPANCTARVHIPNPALAAVLESGIPAEQAEGVEWLGHAEGCSVCMIESGTYSFELSTTGG